MILDALLTFTGTHAGATGGITDAATTDSPTTGTQTASNIVDLGAGSAANPAIPSLASGGGARDIGAGTPKLKLVVQVTTTFVGGTNTYCILAGAADNGSGSPDSYTTMFTGPTVVVANMIQGAQLANNTVPNPVPGQALPRFLRLQFVTSGTHTAGAAIGTIALDDVEQPGAESGTLSGYPPGITISN